MALFIAFWRRGRDSNPRCGDYPHTAFPVLHLRPLGHLSYLILIISKVEVSLTSRKGELYLKVWTSTKKIEPLEVGSGLSKTELALRLRHEIKREFASYVGVSWERHFGQTKEMVGERDLINFLVGLKT